MPEINRDPITSDPPVDKPEQNVGSGFLDRIRGIGSWIREHVFSPVAEAIRMGAIRVFGGQKAYQAALIERGSISEQSLDKASKGAHDHEQEKIEQKVDRVLAGDLTHMLSGKEQLVYDSLTFTGNQDLQSYTNSKRPELTKQYSMSLAPSGPNTPRSNLSSNITVLFQDKDPSSYRKERLSDGSERTVMDDFSDQKCYQMMADESKNMAQALLEFERASEGGYTKGEYLGYCVEIIRPDRNDPDNKGAPNRLVISNAMGSIPLIQMQTTFKKDVREAFAAAEKLISQTNKDAVAHLDPEKVKQHTATVQSPDIKSVFSKPEKDLYKHYKAEEVRKSLDHTGTTYAVASHGDNTRSGLLNTTRASGDAESKIFVSSSVKQIHEDAVNIEQKRFANALSQFQKEVSLNKNFDKKEAMIDGYAFRLTHENHQYHFQVQGPHDREVSFSHSGQSYATPNLALYSATIGFQKVSDDLFNENFAKSIKAEFEKQQSQSPDQTHQAIEDAIHDDYEAPPVAAPPELPKETLPKQIDDVSISNLITYGSIHGHLENGKSAFSVGFLDENGQIEPSVTLVSNHDHALGLTDYQAMSDRASEMITALSRAYQDCKDHGHDAMMQQNHVGMSYSVGSMQVAFKPIQMEDKSIQYGVFIQDHKTDSNLTYYGSADLASVIRTAQSLLSEADQRAQQELSKVLPETYRANENSVYTQDQQSVVTKTEVDQARADLWNMLYPAAVIQTNGANHVIVDISKEGNFKDLDAELIVEAPAMKGILSPVELDQLLHDTLQNSRDAYLPKSFADMPTELKNKVQSSIESTLRTRLPDPKDRLDLLTGNATYTNMREAMEGQWLAEEYGVPLSGQETEEEPVEPDQSEDSLEEPSSEDPDLDL